MVMVQAMATKSPLPKGVCNPISGELRYGFNSQKLLQPRSLTDRPPRIIAWSSMSVKGTIADSTCYTSLLHT